MTEMGDPSEWRLWSDNLNAPMIPYFQYVEEKITFAGTLIGSILYGIVVALFFKCIAALLNPVHLRGGGVKWGFVSYTVAMFSFATVFTAVNLILQSNSYIDNREFMPSWEISGPAPYSYGPFEYQSDTSCPRAFGFIPGLMLLFNYWLADGLLLYRCYVIYGMNPWVIVLPCLMYLSSFATGILSLMPSADWYGSCLLWIAYLKNISDSHYSISISLNVLLTLMIVIRLVLHSRKIRTSMGIAGIGGLCKAIITMLIESSMIYATSSFLVLGMLNTGVFTSSGFLFILAETQVIAPLLIILRVANKTALTNNTIVSGRINTFEARTRGELAGGDGTHPSGDSVSSVNDRGTNSVEPPVEVENTIESYPDEIQAS